MSPLMFVLVCLGISYGISTEMITLPIREWVAKKSKFLGNLIFCNVCTSFWVGCIGGLFVPGFFLFWGFAVMTVMKIIDKISN